MSKNVNIQFVSAKSQDDLFDAIENHLNDIQEEWDFVDIISISHDILVEDDGTHLLTALITTRRGGR